MPRHCITNAAWPSLRDGVPGIIRLDREDRVGTADPTRAAMDETYRYSLLLRFIHETKMEGGVDTIVARLKIAHYNKVLETDTDETRRQIVMRLLAEEHARLVEAISKAIVREARAHETGP